MIEVIVKVKCCEEENIVKTGYNIDNNMKRSLTYAEMFPDILFQKQCSLYISQLSAKI